MMTATLASTRPRSKWRTFATILLCLIAVLALLTISTRPHVLPRAPPTAAQVTQGRDAAQRLRLALSSGGVVPVQFDADEIDSIVALSSNVSNLRYMRVVLAENELIGKISLPIGPAWANFSIMLPPSEAGFPALRLRLGWITLPAFASRWVAELGRLGLRYRGVRAPPLDELVQSVALSNSSVAALVRFPLGSGMLRQIANYASTAPIDGQGVANIYCRLVKLQVAEPSADFSTHVRRAFSVRRGGNVVAHNRETFVALAAFTVSPGVATLASDAAQRIASCSAAEPELFLAGRVDLAKHWALSAALAALFGEDIGNRMGEWKELADSRPEGSGFSFVDLAADRAGVAAGRAGTDSATADRLARNMREANYDTLLPLQALAFSEGLTEAAFIDRYGSTDSAEYARAVKRIDRFLARRALR